VGRLASLLGHDAVAQKIGISLHEDHVVNVIQGPPGVGKSWTAKGLGAVWEEEGGCTRLSTRSVSHLRASPRLGGRSVATWLEPAPLESGSAVQAES
jgi:ABC-type protease/lipase transport system fused ATPase/permease subunit